MPKPRKIHEKNHETSALCNKYFRLGDHLYGVCQSPKKSIINKNCEYFYKNCNIKSLLFRNSKNAINILYNNNKTENVYLL